jgi:hypothetical protein
MRLALSTTALALVTAFSPAANAQSGSVRNGSEASKQAILTVGAVGESGVKASSGVVAIPLGGIAVASGAVAHGADASGYTDVGAAFSQGAAGATRAATSLVDFSGAPLTVTDEVIVGRTQTPAPQPVPQVPYKPEHE